MILLFYKFSTNNYVVFSFLERLPNWTNIFILALSQVQNYMQKLHSREVKICAQYSALVERSTKPS